MPFKPCVKLPDKGDPYYNKKPTGYNPCILGNNDHGQRVKGLNVLPNCVGWAVGRFNSIYHEILGGAGCDYLGSTNAANFISLARKQGLKISKAPTLGGVMVWTGGVSNLGHVAVVEATIGEDTVITSESEYYGLAFVNYTRRRDDGNWRKGCYWQNKTYKYAGCIVNPATEEKPVTYEQFVEYMNRWLAELAAKPADKWAEPAIAYCKANGLMVGDADGNFRPQSAVKREELAAVLKNIDQNMQ